MPELMRRHVNADMSRDGVDDLDCEGCLTLAAAHLGDEDVAIHVGAKARQDVTAIPSKAAGHVVRDLAHNVLPFRFCVSGGNVNKQLAPRTIWFAEMVMPTEGAQVLWPKWQGEQNIDRDRNLGLACKLVHDNFIWTSSAR